MFLKLQPITYTIIFILALEVSAFKKDWFFGVLFFLIIFSFLIIWPLARKIRFLAFPFFLSLGSVSLLFFIDSKIQEQIFIGLSSFVYFLALLGSYRLKFYSCDKTAQGMLNLVTIASMFFWLLSIYAWFLNYAFSFWFLPLVVLFSTVFVSFPSFMVCRVDREKMERKKNLDGRNFSRKNNFQAVFLALVLGVIVAQFSYAVSLWPFSYLTLGGIVLIIFYVFWDIMKNYIQGNLERKRIIFNIIFSIILIFSILLTAQWDLIV